MMLFPTAASTTCVWAIAAAVAVLPSLANANNISESIFTEEEEEAILGAFSFEAIYQPPWATAVTRTLFGYKTDPPAQQFSTYMPYATGGLSNFLESHCNEINDEGAGALFGASDVPFCASTTWKTQLVNGVPGDPSASYNNMRSVCEGLDEKAVSFGSNLEFCALPGNWTQLTGQLPGTVAVSIQAICSQLGGTSFGDNDQFCAVKGLYSQLTSNLPGMSSSEVNDIDSICEQLGGTAVDGYLCILEGVWSQLTTRLLCDSTSAPEDFSTNMCDMLEGTPWNEFCFVEGVASQLSTRLPGDLEFTSSFPGGACPNGFVQSHYCYHKRAVSQLSTRLFGDLEFTSDFPSNQCASLGGNRVDEYCMAPGASQLTTKLPGQSSWANNFPTPACESVDGVTFGNRQCGTVGSTDIGGAPTPAPSPTSAGISFVHGMCTTAVVLLMMVGWNVIM